MKKQNMLAYLLFIFVCGTGISGCSNNGNSDKNIKAKATDSITQKVETNIDKYAEVSKTVEKVNEASTIEAASTNMPAEQPQTKEEIKVTFVELGSVKCVPCKMMQPIMDEIEKEYAGQVKVVFHDVWTAEGQPYGKQYGIRGIPTQVFLDKDGKEYYRHTGYFPKEDLVKILKMQGVK